MNFRFAMNLIPAIFLAVFAGSLLTPLLTHLLTPLPIQFLAPPLDHAGTPLMDHSGAHSMDPAGTLPSDHAVSQSADYALFPMMYSATPLTRHEFSEQHMGTLFRVIIYAPNQKSAEQAADSVFSKVTYLNSIFSDYDEQSELSRLSATSGSGKAVPVSSHLFEILTLSQKLSDETDGAFDVTAGPFTLMWREAIRGLRPQVPDEEKLQPLAGSVGYQHLELDASEQTVKLHRPDMRLDLGGIAKGYTAQRMKEVLHYFGLNRVLVDAGGDIVLGDPPPDTGGWEIAVPSLQQENRNESAGPDRPGVMLLKLSNVALTTSGDLYQYVEQDGIRYSHIVNPHTGMGVTRQTSVLVVGDDATVVDGLATALNILPVEKGLSIIENRDGYYARIAILDENGLEIHKTGTLPGL